MHLIPSDQYDPKGVSGNFVTTLCAACFVVAICRAPLFAVEPCRIEVIEKGSGWPVPLVELRTTHNVQFFTDNAGVIAFDLPELLGRETWFWISGNGYEVPADGFGQRGVRLTPESGKTLKVEVTRSIIAKRLGRLTGAGIFGESQKLGHYLDWRESGVLGSTACKTPCIAGNYFGPGATRCSRAIHSAYSTCRAPRRRCNRWQSSNRPSDSSSIISQTKMVSRAAWRKCRAADPRGLAAT
jgi:hypothetical protein